MQHVRRPLVLACLAFLAGATLGLRSGGALLGAVTLATAILTLLAWGGAEVGPVARRLAPLALLLWAGMANGAWSRTRVAGDCRVHIADGAPLSVEGLLTASHASADSSGRVAVLGLSAGPFRAGSALCDGEIRVRLPRGFGPAPAGTRVRVRGAWWRSPPPVVPGGWPGTAGASGLLMADSAKVLHPPRLLGAPLLWARGRTQASVLRLFPRHAPLADALLLNRRERLDPETSRRFAESGLVHLLAISGSHVAMIGGVLLLLARTVGCSRRAAAWTTIGLVAAYLGLIGAPPSALRSGVMLALVLLGGVLQRPASPLSPMAAAALALVALDPLALLDPGFQLSFAGVAGLCLLRPALLQRLPAAWTRAGWSRAALDAGVSSLAAFATTAPIAAFHFGQSAPISILANLPAIPLASLGLVGIAAAVVAEPIVPPLARLLADGAGVCLDLLGGVAEAAARVPGGHFAVSRPNVPLWLMAGAAALLALHLGARMRPLARAALAGGSLAAVLLLAPLEAAGGAGLELAFLDVGQGDAIALRTPAGRWVLVDAGPLEERYDAGERRVLPYLRTRGASRLEAMILTHPHADHIGGAQAVLRSMPVGRVVEPGLPFASPLYRDLLRAVQESGAAWAGARQDRILRIDGVELLFLWPTPASLDSPEDANDISAVVQVRYGAFRALLTGDAPAWVEERLVARYGESLRSQVLKAGHHGSRSASSEAFLRAVRPELAVLSCGRRNRYGHPAPEALGRLNAARVKVARTDRDGTVVVHVDAGGTNWRWEEP